MGKETGLAASTPLVLNTMRHFTIATLASLALCACSSTPEEVDLGPSVRELVRTARYEAALRRASELAHENPGEIAAADQRMATVAWLIYSGRELSFADRDQEALMTFEQALVLEEESKVALMWVGKTRAKIATLLHQEGVELHAKEDYPGAAAKYAAALDMNPAHESARRGLELARRQGVYRVELAKGYYVEGVRALTDYWLEQAKSRFGYTRKYLPDHERALNRRNKVDGMLAGQRVILGTNYMSRGLYAAARNEFRLAQILRPSTEGVEEFLDHATLEARASDHLLKAEMFVFRGEFTDALQELDKGRVLSELQAEAFEEVRVGIDAEENRLIYERALAYEHDYLYEDAIEVYGELLARTDYFEDARARSETLADYVENAVRLYGEMLDVGESADKLSLLRQIEIFWPEYRDVQERIVRLESVRGA